MSGAEQIVAGPVVRAMVAHTAVVSLHNQAPAFQEAHRAAQLVVRKPRLALYIGILVPHPTVPFEQRRRMILAEPGNPKPIHQPTQQILGGMVRAPPYICRHAVDELIPEFLVRPVEFEGVPALVFLRPAGWGITGYTTEIVANIRIDVVAMPAAVATVADRLALPSLVRLSRRALTYSAVTEGNAARSHGNRIPFWPTPWRFGHPAHRVCYGHACVHTSPVRLRERFPSSPLREPE